MADPKTIELLRQSLTHQPENTEIRLHIGELELALGHHEGCLEMADSALSIDKTCAPAHLLKARSFMAAQDQQSARKHYSLAVVIDESLEDADFEAQLYGNAAPAPSAEAPPTSEPPTEPIRRAMPMAQAQDSFASSEWDVDDSELEDEFDEGTSFENDQAIDEVLASSANRITFADIGGMEELKERIRMSIIYPFQNKELFAKFKKKRGGGVMLYGPPGCGKTLISQATAGECGAHFIDLRIHDVLSKWIGESEQRIHEIFEEARRRAPTILFIDEIDALGIKRSDAGNSSNVVNTLLTELDGGSEKNEDVLVLGATNVPWRVDSAFRRPGRFDHVLFVPPPDAPARESILKLILDAIPQENLDLTALAKASEKFSGADLNAVVDKASEEVLNAVMNGKSKGTQLTQKGLAKALKKSRPTTLEWIEQAANFASFANQSGLYDDLAEWIREHS